MIVRKIRFKKQLATLVVLYAGFLFFRQWVEDEEGDLPGALSC
jgi:hypothetical protein